MKSFKLWLIGFLLIVAAHWAPVWADAPIKSPSLVKRVSENKRFTVVSSRAKGTYGLNETGKMLWKINDWFPEFFVANDGEHFVSIYGGLDLLPMDYRDDMVLFTIWKSGVVERNIQVRDVVPSKAILQRTSSHYYLGQLAGIDKENRLILERSDGVRLAINVVDGKNSISTIGRWRSKILDQ
jgi:hypothetical protein